MFSVRAEALMIPVVQLPVGGQDVVFVKRWILSLIWLLALNNNSQVKCLTWAGIWETK